jgi:hypothetical protein
MKKLTKILHAHSRLLGTIQPAAVPSRADAASRPNLSAQLLYAISRGEIASYSDLQDKIDEAKAPLTSKHYMRTARLRNKILDSMALHDYTGTMRTEYNRSRYEVQRSLMLAHVLKVKGLGAEAMALWEKTYLKARRYSLTFESYLCAQHLCYEYAFRRKYAKYYNTVRSFSKLSARLRAEHEATNLYHRLLLLLKARWYINPSYKPITQRTSVRISSLAARYKTHDLYSMHYRVKFYYHYASHNYRALMNTCLQYRAYLENHRHLQQDSRWAEIALHQINASISIGNYTAGIRVAEENRKYMRPENPNWFSYLENYFQLLMNAGEYLKAKELYGEVMTSTYRRNMSHQQSDVWRVFLAYVQLALHSYGMISRFKPRQHFSILTTCKSDKVGLNFLIEAGMLMYMLIQDNRSDLDRHGERFRKYVKRHIVKKKMPRHYLFSKMLLLMVRHQHRSREHVEKLAARHLKALAKTVHSRPHDFEANELIRFERLWEMLLQQLPVQVTGKAA